ncbi:MAG TPA: transcriptional regulator, partial [Ruminococcus sp.]|nr:transcriptional regulator [Ruminococcus sp.]
SETYAELKTDSELSLARLNEDLQYFCFIKIPENGINSYVDINKRIISLFRLLSDEDALKIIFHL